MRRFRHRFASGYASVRRRLSVRHWWAAKIIGADRSPLWCPSGDDDDSSDDDVGEATPVAAPAAGAGAGSGEAGGGSSAPSVPAPAAAPAPAPAAASAPAPSKSNNTMASQVRYDWYESAKWVTIDVMSKNIDKEASEAKFETQAVRVPLHVQRVSYPLCNACGAPSWTCHWPCETDPRTSWTSSWLGRSTRRNPRSFTARSRPRSS